MLLGILGGLLVGAPLGYFAHRCANSWALSSAFDEGVAFARERALVAAGRLSPRPLEAVPEPKVQRPPLKGGATITVLGIVNRPEPKEEKE
jgi:hypothetical protein